MKISSVQIENFGSWSGSQIVEMSGQGLVLVEGQNLDDPGANSNGSGKSTLFDAIDWCLFGKVPRGDNVDSVINKDAAKARVSVNLIDGDQTIYVLRSRGPQGTALGVRVISPAGEQVIDTLDVAETQRRLELVLGLDRQVFHAAVLRGQSDRSNFCEASQSDRLDILTRILQLDEIDRMLEAAKDRVAAAVGRASETSTAAEVTATQLTEVQQTLVSAQAAADSWERQERQRIDARKAELAEYRQKLLYQLASPTVEELRQRLVDLATPPRAPGVSIAAGQLEDRLTSLDANRPMIVPAARMVLEDEAQRLRGRVEDNSKRLGAAQADARRLANQLSMAQSRVGGPCPACGQIISGDHLAREIERLNGELASATGTATGCEVAVSEGKALLAEVSAKISRQSAQDAEATSAWLVQRTKVEKALREQQQQDAEEAAELVAVWTADKNRVEQSLRAQETGIMYLEQAQAELDRLSGELPANPHLGLLGGLANRQQALVRAVEDTKLAQDAAQKALDAANYMVEALGPKGLKSYILDMQLQQLTDAANKWVSLLTGGSMMVQFVSQVALRSAKAAVKNSIDVRVWRYEDGKMVERAYRSWSGGERQRISLGIDFGLAELVAKRASRCWDVLILDELFRHLDRSGKEAAVGMLRQLRDTKTDIFVVEHDPDFADQFDKRARVVKQGGRSTWQAAETTASPILGEVREMDANAVPQPQAETEGQGAGATPKQKRAPRKRGRVPIHAAVPKPGDSGAGGAL